MARFSNDADMLGTSLFGYAKNVVREVLSVGRSGTLVDWEGDFEQRAFASAYRAEDILNWRVERVNGRSVPTLIVLRVKSMSLSCCRPALGLRLHLPVPPTCCRYEAAQPRLPVAKERFPPGAPVQASITSDTLRPGDDDQEPDRAYRIASAQRFGGQADLSDSRRVPPTGLGR